MNEQPAKAPRPLSGLELENAVLRARVETLTTSGIIEVALQNTNVRSYMEHWESRAEKAEAKLAESTNLQACPYPASIPKPSDNTELESQAAALRQVVNHCRLAFAGYVSVQSAIDMIDNLPEYESHK